MWLLPGRRKEAHCKGAFVFDLAGRCVHQPLCRDIFRIFCIIRPIHVTKWKQSRNADKQTIDEAKKRRPVGESNIVDPPGLGRHKSGTGLLLRRLRKYKRNF